MSSFRILSIDGGGVRAILSAILLQRIQDEVPEIFDETLFFAGTDTGSLLALGLAYGIPPIELIELLNAFIQEVLKQNLVNKVGSVVGAKYNIMNLVKILGPYFGAAVLQDILQNKGKFVLIPSFDLDGHLGEIRTWKPKFFHNFPGEDADIGELVLDVITRSAALPVYFSSYQGYIGGNVVARNPSMSALAQALQGAPDGLSIQEIRLFSLGTGYFPRYITGKEHDWGLGRWSWPLISMVLDSEMGVSSYQCMRILGPERFHRLQPILEEPVGLDETDKVPNLIEFANELDIGPTVDWLKNNFMEPSDTVEEETDSGEVEDEVVEEEETTTSPSENGNGSNSGESSIRRLIRILSE